MEWPSGRSNEAEIDSYLKPSERHHRHSLDELANEPGVPDRVVELYEGLVAASAGRLEDLQAVYDRARQFFAGASDLFVPEIDRLQQGLDAAIGEGRRASAALAECEPVRRRFEAEIRSGEEKRARLEAGVRKAEKQRRELEARIEEQQQTDLRLQTELEESLQVRRRLERRILRLEADLQKVQGHLTAILASRWYRFTRVPRTLFGGVSRWLRYFVRSLRD